jgi:hypothetical protein
MIGHNLFHKSSITSDMDRPARCIRYIFHRSCTQRSHRAQSQQLRKKTLHQELPGAPGFCNPGIAIQLKSPLLIGLLPASPTILMPFTKPCYGTISFEVKAEDGDFAGLRSSPGKNMNNEK